MIEPRHDLYAGRGFARRLVELPCELVTRHDDAPLLHWGSDLSESGLYVETAAPLAAGEGLVVCFRPAVGWRMPELTLFAEVARVALGRRRGDGASGMGLRFLDLKSGERRALSRWLKPRPRKVPSPRLEPPRAVFAFGEHPFASRVS